MTDKTVTAKSMVCPLCEGNVIDVDALQEFITEMKEKTIPEIVKIMRERQEAAAMSRHKIIG